MMREEKEYRPSNLIFVRHGESVWNAWGLGNKKEGIPPPRMEGVPDHKTPLTDRGKEQARQTGMALFENFGKPAAIFHSPYVRTTETAEIIQQSMYGCGAGVIPLHRDLLLVEQQFGTLDAAVAVAIGMDMEKFRETQREFEARREVVGKFYAKPPDGKSWYDVAVSTHDILDKFFRPRWHAETLVVVSHAVTIATFLYHLHGRDEESTVAFYEQSKLKNCGVAHFRHNPESQLRWDLVCWNKIYWTC